MANIARYWMIALFVITILTHLLKIIYLVHPFKAFEKYPFISNKILTKRQLILYYVLTILAMMKTISWQLNGFN